jgi:hypothetical protein
MLKIAELPFHERPVLELLHLDVDRDQPDPSYAGYGWARVERIWLGETRIDDALVLALHSADDGERLVDDVELEFELPGPGLQSVTVLASAFLERWLPRLPSDAQAIVLVMCNPFDARLRYPNGASGPVHYALGDVESWLDPDDRGARIRIAAKTWCTLDAP